MKNYQAIEDFVIENLKRGLARDLCYHDASHTYDVLRSAELIAATEKVDGNNLDLLKVATLYHDAGFMSTYKNHEEASCVLARAELPRFGLSHDEIEIICGLIMTTKLPQSPKTQLGKIIADADLEYLGTPEFDERSHCLYQEVKIYLGVKTWHDWDVIQDDFISHHHYFTDFCRTNREPLKQKHLAEVRARL